MNAYAFLLLLCGVTVALIPLFRISKWLIAPQAAVCLFFAVQSFHLFSTWEDKKIKYKILMGKNRNGFRPDSFEVYMNAPCGRLLAKAVLKDLGIKERYRELLAYRKPFLVSIKNGCVRQETKIYINEKK